MEQAVIAMAAGVAIGVAALSTAWAQKEIGSAALGAIAENEKTFVPGLIYLVVPETIIVFGLLVAYLLIQKV